MRKMISLFAVCTPICTDTVWEDWYRFCMRQERENAFAYPLYFEQLRKFLRITKAEVNLLPHNQTFNYNVNCILNTNGVREKYGVIEQIYAE